jgi:hypothetical protein
MDEALMDEVNDTSEETIITEEGSRWDKRQKDEGW